MSLKSSFKSKRFGAKIVKTGEEYTPIFNDDEELTEDDFIDENTNKQIDSPDNKKEESFKLLPKTKTNEEKPKVSQNKDLKKRLNRAKSYQENSISKTTFMKKAANLFMRTTNIQPEEETDDSEEEETEKMIDFKKN